MSDTADSQVGEGSGPVSLPIEINAQYIKDLSFENPRAPKSLRPQQLQPKVEVHVDVKATRLAEETYEVTLTVTVNGANDEGQLFLVELSYAGVFTLKNMPQEHIQAVLLIECPRLIFPFARNIVADVTRDGGFPPLLIQPVDFGQLYRQSLATENLDTAGEVNPPTE